MQVKEAWDEDVDKTEEQSSATGIHTALAVYIILLLTPVVSVAEETTAPQDSKAQKMAEVKADEEDQEEEEGSSESDDSSESEEDEDDESISSYDRAAKRIRVSLCINLPYCTNTSDSLLAGALISL